MTSLTTSSYAVLGLLNLRPWSAYDLTQQAKRSLRYAWPKSESQLYAEPKRLVNAGLATVSDEPAGPRRTRRVYRITAKGRRELKRWLATQPAPPQLEFEAILRLLYADAGDKEDLVAAFDSTLAEVRRRYDEGLAILHGYLEEEAPFPDRLHISVLLGSFARDLLWLFERWLEFASAEVAQWPDTKDVGMSSRTREILRALTDERQLLPELTNRSTAPTPRTRRSAPDATT